MSFVVTSVQGRPDATRVVFLVPQFHRSPLLPVLWSSLGEAIAGVQANIDIVITRLVRAHGVTCLGVEGSWFDPITRFDEIAQVGGWAIDLERRRDAALRELPAEAAALKPPMDVAIGALEPYLRRQALTLDGAGMALARLSRTLGAPAMRRFGVEDEVLNQRALALLARMRPMQEELALLEPEGQPDSEDELGRIWLDEYGAFKRDVSDPLRTALKTLQDARLAHMKDGDDAGAQAIGRFASLVSLLADELLRLDEVDEYHAYYSKLREGMPEKEKQKKKRLTTKQRRRQKELRKALARLDREYERVANGEREKAAARKVVMRMGEGAAATCALVMGANHEDGLVKALLELGGGKLAVVVVAPYNLDEGGE